MDNNSINTELLVELRKRKKELKDAIAAIEKAQLTIAGMLTMLKILE